MQKTKELVLCQDKLKSLLNYDPKTGIFTWKTTGKGRRLDLSAGTRHPEKGGGFRCMITISGRLYKASRLAFLYMTGRWPTLLIDHKNGNMEDDSWRNLREATVVQNRLNSKKPSTNKSGYKGVRIQRRCKKSPYEACIGINGKYIHLGSFSNPKDAAKAYAKAARARDKKFARLA